LVRLADTLVKRWGLDEALVRAHHLGGRGVRPEVVMRLINLILDKTGAK